MEKSSTVFVGMDVHKESIDITLAEPGGEVRRLGAIGGDRGSLLKMVRRQQSKGRKLVFVYEAGPCGFWIYREITALGHACMVVSPSLIPRRAGDHVKTDRRDSSWVIWAWCPGKTPRGSTATRARSPRRATATRAVR